MGRARCGRATGGRVSARQGLSSCGIRGEGIKQANTARLLCRQTRFFAHARFDEGRYVPWRHHPMAYVGA
jgi:hypothetical protein